MIMKIQFSFLSTSKEMQNAKAQVLQENNSLELLKLEDALSSMEGMHQPPSVETLTCILHKCRRKKNLALSLRLHAYMRDCGLETHGTLGNYLVPMLVEVGSMCDARQVFDRLVCRNEYSWNSLITGFVKCGESQHAFMLYKKMQEDSVHPSGYTFVALLKACAKLKDVERGCELHAEIARHGLEKDLFVGSSLVDMYAKCGLLTKAQEVFDNLAVRDAVSWNALIAGYFKHGLGEEVLKFFKQMQLEGIAPSPVTFVCSLKACGSIGATDKGREIHVEIARKGLLERDLDVGNALVDLYADCGLLAEAEEVFDKLPARDTVSWTALIGGYSKHKLAHEALSCFEQMQLEGIAPSVVTFVCSLKACGSIGATHKGQEIHAEIVRKGLLQNDLVGTALVDMYANFGSLSRAQGVFDNLLVRDIVSWTALIAGYSKHGHGEEALNCFRTMQLEGVSPDAISWNVLIEGYAKHGCGEAALNCFEQMQSQGVSPDAVTFVFSLKACGSIGAMSKGQELHAEIARKGLLERDLVIGNALVDLYANCGLLAEAQQVFDQLPIQDVVSWTALMAGYTKHGLGQEALNYFEQMQLESVAPSKVTFVCSLKACGSVKATEKGQEIHVEIEKKGFLECDLVVGNALVDMYANCGLLAEAQEVFDKLPVQDLVSWTALIAGYAKHGHSEEALDCFEQMQLEGVIPDAVSWSALIAGYAKHNCGEEALNCLEEMKLEGVSPDAVTFASSLKACGSVRAIDKGRQIHAEMARKGLLERDLVVGNALVDMYATCGLLAEAQDVFDKLPVWDAVSWTALIAGYTKHGCGEEALNCFEQMQLEGFSPDVVTFICSMKACGSIGATEKGQEIHREIAKNGLLKRDLIVGNALLEMYTNCGLLAKAQEVFDKLPVRDTVSWAALIAGYAKHGCSEEALNCFEQMQLKGVSPDAVSWNALIAGYARLGESENVFLVLDRMKGEGIKPSVDTFTSVLTACSHAGLVDIGHSYFEVMSKDYCITPTIEHHVCMVDLFGRAGQLDKAVTVIKKMPYYPNVVLWHTVLGACRKWGNVELGRWAFEHAVRLDERDAGVYVCMSNIYADAGMQEDVRKVDQMRVIKQAWGEGEYHCCIAD